MKKTAGLLILTLMLCIFTGCGSSVSEADFKDPEAVIEEFLSLHPISEDETQGIYDDLSGKTVSVKTNEKTQPVYLVYDALYHTTSQIQVMLSGENGEYGNFDYEKGDTLVLEIEYVMMRGTKDGKIRQYFINVILPE